MTTKAIKTPCYHSMGTDAVHLCYECYRDRYLDLDPKPVANLRAMGAQPIKTS